MTTMFLVECEPAAEQFTLHSGFDAAQDKARELADIHGLAASSFVWRIEGYGRPSYTLVPLYRWHRTAHNKGCTKVFIEDEKAIYRENIWPAHQQDAVEFIEGVYSGELVRSKPTLDKAVGLAGELYTELYKGQLCNGSNDLTLEESTAIINLCHRVRTLSDNILTQKNLISERRAKSAEGK